MYALEVLNPVAQQRGRLDHQARSTRGPPAWTAKTVGLLWSGTHRRRRGAETGGRPASGNVQRCDHQFLHRPATTLPRRPSSGKPPRSATWWSAPPRIEGRARRGCATT